MEYSFRRIASEPAVAEPITLDEARLHLRLDTDADDRQVEKLIAAARELAERYTGRLFTAGLYEMTADRFERAMKFPCAPVGQIVSVVYDDANGVEQILPPESYRLYPHPDKPSLFFVPGVPVPVVFALPGAVRIRFTGAYGTEDWGPVSELATAAMKLTLGHLFENREDVITGTIATEMPNGAVVLLSPLRRDLEV